MYSKCCRRWCFCNVGTTICFSLHTSLIIIKLETPTMFAHAEMTVSTGILSFGSRESIHDRFIQLKYLLWNLLGLSTSPRGIHGSYHNMVKIPFLAACFSISMTFHRKKGTTLDWSSFLVSIPTNILTVMSCLTSNVGKGLTFLERDEPIEATHVTWLLEVERCLFWGTTLGRSLPVLVVFCEWIRCPLGLLRPGTPIWVNNHWRQVCKNVLIYCNYWHWSFITYYISWTLFQWPELVDRALTTICSWKLCQIWNQPYNFLHCFNILFNILMSSNVPLF